MKFEITNATHSVSTDFTLLIFPLQYKTAPNNSIKRHNLYQALKIKRHIIGANARYSIVLLIYITMTSP
ncbi:MAG TPA: hypothetical protein VGB43_03675 [Flavobacterium sp.]